MTVPASTGGQASEELRFDIRSVLRLTSRDRANIRDAADLARLLPGEDPKTERQDDIEHWIVTYRELGAHNRELIRRLARPAPSPDPVDAAPEALDLPLVQAHALRIRLRLYYWMARGRRLRKSPIAKLKH